MLSDMPPIVVLSTLRLLKAHFCLYILAIKRTPHYDVRSALPRGLNIGTVWITAPARTHQK